MSKRKNDNSGGLAFIGGLGVGLGLMYTLDPNVGTRRRALVKDKLVHSGHLLEDALEKGTRDLAHRSRGFFSRIRSRYVPDDVSDARLVARVRSELGRLVSHPRAIEVTARDGHIVLRGPILTREVDELLEGIACVRGVQSIEPQLDLHATGDHIPALQGGFTRERRHGVRQENWPPSTRLLASGFGLFMSLWGIRRGDLLGLAAAGAGAAGFIRGVTNMPVKRITGIGAGHRAIDFHKTITVRAPLEEVFRFWSDFANFPRFMQHVKEVRVLDDKRSHWVVCGPGGTSVGWDAEITRLLPNKIVAWKTTSSSSIEHAGIIHFEEAGPGATRLDIRMSYNPPAGLLGHGIASLFHVDPKTAMDDDLVRMKSLLEEGKATAHGHTVTMRDLH
jgi:uncharacterized membrane protein